MFETLAKAQRGPYCLFSHIVPEKILNYLLFIFRLNFCIAVIFISPIHTYAEIKVGGAKVSASDDFSALPRYCSSFIGVRVTFTFIYLEPLKTAE